MFEILEETYWQSHQSKEEEGRDVQRFATNEKGCQISVSLIGENKILNMFE